MKFIRKKSLMISAVMSTVVTIGLSYITFSYTNLELELNTVLFGLSFLCGLGISSNLWCVFFGKDENAEYYNLCLQDGLDKVQHNIMIVDEYYYIIYINNSLRLNLKTSDYDIGLGKSICNLFGTIEGRIDKYFAEEPQHIKIGKNNFKVVATQLAVRDNKTIGYILEWLDVSHATVANKQINLMLDSLNRGELPLDITLPSSIDSITNFNSLNTVLEIYKTYISDLTTIFSQADKKQIRHEFSDKYVGKLGEIVKYINSYFDEHADFVYNVYNITSGFNENISNISVYTQDFHKNMSTRTETLKEMGAAVNKINSRLLSSMEKEGSCFDKVLSISSLSDEQKDICTGSAEDIKNIIKIFENIKNLSKKVENFSFQTKLLSINSHIDNCQMDTDASEFSEIDLEIKSFVQRTLSSIQSIKTSTGILEDKFKLLLDWRENFLLNSSKSSVKCKDLIHEFKYLSTESKQNLNNIEKVQNYLRSISCEHNDNVVRLRDLSIANNDLLSQVNKLGKNFSELEVDDEQTYSQIAMVRSKNALYSGNYSLPITNCDGWS